MTFQLDTGAECNLLSLKDYQRATGCSHKFIKTYTNERYKILRSTALPTWRHGKRSVLQFNITDDDLAPLSSYRTCIELGLVTIKDIHDHCYCPSLVRTLYMTWCVPRHVFQACAPSRNSTKYRADELCGNLICKYFCWILSDSHFFFQQITSFSDSFHYTKKQKNLCVGSFNYFSYTCTIQIGSNWYVDTGVCDLEVACFKANCT